MARVRTVLAALSVLSCTLVCVLAQDVRQHAPVGLESTVLGRLASWVATGAASDTSPANAKDLIAEMLHAGMAAGAASNLPDWLSSLTNAGDGAAAAAAVKAAGVQRVLQAAGLGASPQTSPLHAFVSAISGTTAGGVSSMGGMSGSSSSMSDASSMGGMSGSSSSMSGSSDASSGSLPGRSGGPLLTFLSHLLGPVTVGAGAATGGIGDDGWKDLLVLDCSGALRLSNGVAGTVVNMQENVVSEAWLYDQISSRAKCACPSISDAEILRRFVPSLEGLIASMTGVHGGADGVKDSCPGKFARGFFADNFWDMVLESAPVQYNLPDTCTYDKLAAGGSCDIELKSSILDASLLLSAKTCPDSSFPFLSLSCSGWYCRNFLQPCDTNSDCGAGGECTTVMDASDIEDGLLNLRLANASSELDQCDLAAWVQEGMQFFGSFYDSQPAAYPTDMRVCFPSQATIQAVKRELKGTVTKTSLASQTAACMATGCQDVLVIGDGACNPECNNAACLDDGGDCSIKRTFQCPTQSQYYECSGHGYCNAQYPTGDDDEQDDDSLPHQCQCDSGWKGDDCSGVETGCVASPDAQVVCSGYGQCIPSQYGGGPEGSCQCNDGHFGPRCSITYDSCASLPFAPSDATLPCSGHGVCRGQEAKAVFCECFDGWSTPQNYTSHEATGAPCSMGYQPQGDLTQCPGYMAEYDWACSGHGMPQLLEDSCTCSCTYGYSGPGCSNFTAQGSNGYGCYSPYVPLSDDDDSDDDINDDDDAGTKCFDAGYCLPAVLGFPEQCACLANMGSAQTYCQTPQTQYGPTFTESSCVFRLGGCSVSLRTHVLPFATWDGKLPSGASASSADRTSGYAFSTAAPPLQVQGVNGKNTMFYQSCDGSVGFQLGPGYLGIAATTGNQAKLSGAIFSQIDKLQQCRAKSLGVQALTADQFLVRFVISNPLFWLYSYTGGANGPPTSFELGFPGVDWMPANPDLDPLAYDLGFKLAPPSTCSFSAALAMQKRTCAFSYSQLTELLGGTVNLDVEVTQCPDDMHGWQPPSMGVTASGYMVQALASMAPCSGPTQTCSGGTGLGCVNLAAAGYLNLATDDKRDPDPLGVFLFGSPSINDGTCSSKSTFLQGVDDAVLMLAGRKPQSRTDLYFCSFEGGLTSTKLLEWLVTAASYTCLIEHTSCVADPVTLSGLVASNSPAAPPTSLNTDVTYHGVDEPPPGKAWVEFTVLLPGVTKVTLGVAQSYKAAVAADLISSVDSLGAFTPNDVLIMDIKSADADVVRSTTANGARRLSDSSVGVVTNLQVEQSAKSNVNSAVSSSSSFSSSLGKSLAAHGVVSKANAGKVSSAPGSNVPDQGLSLGDIIGISVGCVAVASLLAVGGFFAYRRHRHRRNALLHESEASTAPLVGDTAGYAPPPSSTEPLIGRGSSSAGFSLPGTDGKSTNYGGMA